VINIAVEGVDGVGKTTLCNNLANHLMKTHGLQATVIRQPNDIIQGLRACAKHPNVAVPDLAKMSSANFSELEKLRTSGAACVEATSLLMLGGMAATSEYIAKLDAELAKVNQELVVIHDRSLLSTLVYQAISRGAIHLIDPILFVATTFCRLRYDKTFILTGQADKISKRTTLDCPFDKNIDVVNEAYASGYERLIQRAASLDMLDAFYRMFPSVTTIDTETKDQAETLESAIACLTNLNLSLKSPTR
jgi:thymidylate kinase